MFFLGFDGIFTVWVFTARSSTGKTIDDFARAAVRTIYATSRIAPHMSVIDTHATIVFHCP
jgi:hypothetical protein